MITAMFPAVKYKAIDYVYEASTRQKLTMNWLVLPVPYRMDRTDLYTHTGTLPEAVYRKPWTRGMVISMCKLSISGSILEDLKSTGQQVHFHEKFDFPPPFQGGVSVEVVPSSNPASQSELEVGEALWLVGGCERACAETFTELSEDLLWPGEQPAVSGLYLREEVLFVDHLLRFGEQLPRLRAIFGRLKTVTLPEPPWCPAGNGLSEEFLFSCCLPFEEPRAAGAEHDGPGLMEEFSPMSVLQEEALMLPALLGSGQPWSPRRAPLLPVLRQAFSPAPEQTDTGLSCREELSAGTPFSTRLSAEISDFGVSPKLPEDVPGAGPSILLDLTCPVHSRLYPQLETDLTLSPPRRSPRTLLSSSGLPVEQMSPVYRLRLVSDCTREKMEEALWKAEKQLPAVLSLLLAEPQIPEPSVQRRPAAEAFTLIEPEAQRSAPPRPGLEDHETPPLWTPDAEEVLERMEGSGPSEPAQVFTEEFLPFSFCHIDNILRKCSEDLSYPVTLVEDIPTPCAVSDTLESSHQEMQITSQEIITEETTTNQDDQGVEPELVGGSRRGGGIFSEQEERSVHKALPTRAPVKTRPGSCPFAGLEEELDPLAAFMMLRSQQKPRVATVPQNSFCRVLPKPETVVAIEPKEDPKPSCVTSAGRGSEVRTQEASGTAAPEARDDSQVICVPASESQRTACGLLHAVAAPHLSSARELGLNASTCGDFSALTLDHAHFLLKQQEKELSASGRQGEPSEQKVLLYRKVAAIHLLLTVRDLLLQCDFYTALDYLAGAREAGAEPREAGRLGKLWAELRVVQYLSQKSQEPPPKITALLQQLQAWIQTSSTQRPRPKALVITSVDSDSVRALLVKSLSHLTGAPAAAAGPAEGGSRLEARRLRECLQRCWCAVVCGQHIGPDFPWPCFSLAVEFEQVGSSSWASVCREQGIQHISFRTTMPHCDADACDLELHVPFTLLVTESLLPCHTLLQTLESTYDMTVLERDYPHSLKMLGRTAHYSVITVDESTGLLIQDLEELATDRSSESFVLRMTALSLQYSCCWVLFYCPEGRGEGYTFNSEVFRNLVLIYASLVLFGLKSEHLDIKVMIAAKDSQLAGCIQRIFHQTLMSSGRDPLDWLDRGWLSVLPSEEEERLTRFPSISPLVAQRMLRRAPSLQWLLGATLPELEEILPQVPRKVFKLFSDITALYRLNVSHSPPGSPATPAQDAQSGLLDEPKPFPADPFALGDEDAADFPRYLGSAGGGTHSPWGVELTGGAGFPGRGREMGAELTGGAGFPGRGREMGAELTGGAGFPGRGREMGAELTGGAGFPGRGREMGAELTGGAGFPGRGREMGAELTGGAGFPGRGREMGAELTGGAGFPGRGREIGAELTGGAGFPGRGREMGAELTGGAGFPGRGREMGAELTGGVEFPGRGREMGAGKPALPEALAWAIGHTRNASAGNALQGGPSLRNTSGPWHSAGTSSQTPAFPGGFASQRPRCTPATYLAPPTPTGSQWNGPFGGASRPGAGSPCEYGAEDAEAEGGLWRRPGLKRGAAEQEDWKTDLPQLKKGKLTYEKVPGRSDGQTRLTFF